MIRRPRQAVGRGFKKFPERVHGEVTCKAPWKETEYNIVLVAWPRRERLG